MVLVSSHNYVTKIKIIRQSKSIQRWYRYIVRKTPKNGKPQRLVNNSPSKKVFMHIYCRQNKTYSIKAISPFGCFGFNALIFGTYINVKRTCNEQKTNESNCQSINIYSYILSKNQMPKLEKRS